MAKKKGYFVEFDETKHTPEDYDLAALSPYEFEDAGKSSKSKKKLTKQEIISWMDKKLEIYKFERRFYTKYASFRKNFKRENRTLEDINRDIDTLEQTLEVISRK